MNPNPMRMIKRDDVFAILDQLDSSGEIKDAISKQLPWWPAPNPEERDDRNIMGETEDQFWALVEPETVRSRWPVAGTQMEPES